MCTHNNLSNTVTRWEDVANVIKCNGGSDEHKHPTVGALASRFV